MEQQCLNNFLHVHPNKLRDISGDINAVVTLFLGRLHRELAPDAVACNDLDVKFHMGQASIHLDNLFGGNNELGEHKLNDVQ